MGYIYTPAFFTPTLLCSAFFVCNYIAGCLHARDSIASLLSSFILKKRGGGLNGIYTYPCIFYTYFIMHCSFCVHLYHGLSSCKRFNCLTSYAVQPSLEQEAQPQIYVLERVRNLPQLAKNVNQFLIFLRIQKQLSILK